MNTTYAKYIDHAGWAYDPTAPRGITPLVMRRAAREAIDTGCDERPQIVNETVPA